MVLIDREFELLSLDSAFADSVSGNSRIVLVEGAVGCGKTEIAETVAERAATAGALVLRGIGSAAERELPLGVIGQLVNSAPPGTLPEPGAEPEAGRIEAMQAFCTAVHDLAATAPVVVCVDDLHLVDALSCQYLLHLARRSRQARILLVLTESAHERGDDPVFGTELLRRPNFTRIRLERLTREAVAQLLARHSDIGADNDADALPDRFFSVSGGNPLLLRALVEEYRVAQRLHPGEPVTAPEAGGAFAQAVLACLYRCGAATTELAEAVAVLGDHGSTDLAARLLGSAGAPVAQGLAALNAAGLLDGCHFRHPTARATVLDRMDAAARTALHRRAAELTYRCGAGAPAVAEQLLAAHHADEPWAVTVLRAAADQLLADGAAERAASCLELAYEASADEAQRAELQTALAAATWRIHPGAAERHLTGPLAALRADVLPAAAIGRLARLLTAQGRIDEAAEALERLAAADGDAQRRARPAWGSLRDDPLDGLTAFPRWGAPRARGAQDGAAPAERQAAGHHSPGHHAPAHHTAAHHPGAHHPATHLPGAHVSGVHLPGAHHSGAAPAPAQQHPPAQHPDRQPTRGRSPASLWTIPEYTRDGAGAEAAELFLRGATLADTTLAPIVQALRAVLHTEGPIRALPWCQVFTEEAARRNSPGWHAVFTALHAEALLRQGDLAGAEQHASAALDLVPERGGSVFVSGVAATLIRARTAMGRHDEAARELSRPVPEGLAGSFHGLMYLHARGHYHLATNRFHAALGDFLDVGRTMKRWGVDRPLLLPWRAGAAEALLQLGEAHQAARFVADQLGTRDAVHPWVNGISLRLRAVSCEPKERQVLLTKAVDELRGSGDRLELARAMADLGQALKELGEPGRANMVNRRAWHLAQECGAEALREKILPGHTGAGGAPEDVPTEAAYAELDAKLSESEKRVAMLAVHGHTNREIAMKLYITVSTVEQHLTRVYRKLNITRRQELPMDLQLLSTNEMA
jgi:DNA-binding CsgD family transcriptional regulator